MIQKIRTWFIFLVLYAAWFVLCLLGLVAIILDPIKLRLVQPLVRLWGKVSIFIMRLPVKISGLENLEGVEKGVLVCNHTSAVDIPLILGYVPLRIGFLAKKEVVYVPLIGQIILLMGHVLVDRSNPRAALKSIDRCKGAYERGISIALFPEGTRSRDGSVSTFKGGSMRIPVQAGAHVIPISIYGGHEVMRKNELIIRKKPVYMHIGKPISSEVSGKDEFKQFVKRVEETVRSNVEHLREDMERDYPPTGDDK